MVTAHEQADPPEAEISPTVALAAPIAQEFLHAARQAAHDQDKPVDLQALHTINDQGTDKTTRGSGDQDI